MLFPVVTIPPQSHFCLFRLIFILLMSIKVSHLSTSNMFFFIVCLQFSHQQFIEDNEYQLFNTVATAILIIKYKITFLKCFYPQNLLRPQSLFIRQEKSKIRIVWYQMHITNNNLTRKAWMQERFHPKTENEDTRPLNFKKKDS